MTLRYSKIRFTRSTSIELQKRIPDDEPQLTSIILLWVHQIIAVRDGLMHLQIQLHRVLHTARPLVTITVDTLEVLVERLEQFDIILPNPDSGRGIRRHHTPSPTARGVKPTGGTKP